MRFFSLALAFEEWGPRVIHGGDYCAPLKLTQSFSTNGFALIGMWKTNSTGCWMWSFMKTLA